MKKKSDIIISFAIAFAAIFLGVGYYTYLKAQTAKAMGKVFYAIEAIENKYIGVGYENLTTIKNPTYIDFKVTDLDFVSDSASAFVKTADLRVNNEAGFLLILKEIDFGTALKIAEINMNGLNKDINLSLQDIEFSGIVFDDVDISARAGEDFLEIKQLVLTSKKFSLVAQGGCEFKSLSDYKCKLNTSSKGALEFLQKAEEKDIFTSRGVYVATLVLRSQTSQRTIAAIEATPEGFYIKNILMTPEGKSQSLDN